MQSEAEIAQQLLQTRINESVDVSGAFDNCFFHCYGTYLLANKLPLPDDLFTFKSLLGGGSSAAQLQALFPNTISLNVFDDYERLNNRDQYLPSPNHVFEKSLVLGFLMREWFATKLSTDNDHRDAMLQGGSGILSIFKTYKEFRPYVGKEQLLTGDEGTKYQSNENFLEYFTARPIHGRVLTAEETRFEKYFTDARHNEDDAISAYWEAEGYIKYCKFLAQPKVKLSYSDVVPVLQRIGQPLVIYDNSGTVLSEHGSQSPRPTLEISIDTLAGHYHLLKTETTQELLDEYTASSQQYKDDRSAVLAHEGDKSAEALRKDSLLVGAICPAGQLPKEPFEVLMERLTDIRQYVRVRQVQADEDEEAVAPNYSFLLKAGAYLSTAISLASFVIATLAILTVISMSTAGVGTALAIGTAACAGAFGLFKAANKQLKEEDQPIPTGPAFQ